MSPSQKIVHLKGIIVPGQGIATVFLPLQKPFFVQANIDSKYLEERPRLPSQNRAFQVCGKGDSVIILPLFLHKH